MEDKLPIGSIIKIKNRKERYIILGKNIENNNMKYDYMCSNYPYGFVLERECFFFQDKDIESLLFLGNINEIRSE